MIELKGCPFCGGKGSLGLFRAHDKKQWRINCVDYALKCGAKTSWFDTIDEAVTAWNNRDNRDNRAPDPYQQDIIKAAVKAIEDVVEDEVPRVISLEGYCFHEVDEQEACHYCVEEYLAPHLEALKGLIDVK
jgi:hypothetical protein